MIHTAATTGPLGAIVDGLDLREELDQRTLAAIRSVLIAGWTPFSRLAIKHTGAGYIDSVRAMGASTWWILSRHILRNATRPLPAHTCLRFANTMFTLVGLSFLGLSAQPPTPIRAPCWPRNATTSTSRPDSCSPP
jgi:peptide/nickel transport system permease protein